MRHIQLSNYLNRKKNLSLNILCILLLDLTFMYLHLEYEEFAFKIETFVKYGDVNI